MHINAYIFTNSNEKQIHTEMCIFVPVCTKEFMINKYYEAKFTEFY